MSDDCPFSYGNVDVRVFLRISSSVEACMAFWVRSGQVRLGPSFHLFRLESCFRGGILSIPTYLLTLPAFTQAESL